MKFSKEGIFKENKTTEIKNMLKEMQQDYTVWVNCNDSIYPVTGINEGNIYDMVSISSVETYGKPYPKLTVKEILDQLKGFPGNSEVCLEAVSNIDQELDMQMDSAREIAGWGIDDVCHMVFFISGKDIDF